MLDLEKIRGKIDTIDNQIVQLFEERMTFTREVAAYKIENQKKVLDKEREEAKLDSLQALATEDYNRYPIKELFTQIMSMSRKYQYSLIPAYSDCLTFSGLDNLPFPEGASIICFGEPGSYTEQAGEDFFKKDFICHYASSFKEVMEKVQKGTALYGVLPIENSSTGGILDTYDLLLKYNNYIVGEQILKIDQALVGLKGSHIEDLKTVYSHPQGLLQCNGFFETHPQIKAIEYSSTSASAKKICADGDRSQGAISSQRAAAQYGLEVLKPNLNDEGLNSTRFIIISNQKFYLKNAGKISICFELPHESGSLYNMLSHFIYNNLNLTKIESRPLRGRPWEYRFFIDFEGNLAHSGVKNAIHGIKEEAASLWILGNFSIQ